MCRPPLPQVGSSLPVVPPTTSYSTSRRPAATLQGSVDQGSLPYSMAHSSSRWSAHQLGASTPKEQAIRLCSVVQAGQQGAVGMLQDFAALSRYPVCSGSVSEHLGRPLVDLLPCAQERHGQGARLCRPAAATCCGIKYEHFKMEGLHTVAQMLCRNDYMTKIGISDFYHHFLLQQQGSR